MPEEIKTYSGTCCVVPSGDPIHGEQCFLYCSPLQFVPDCVTLFRPKLDAFAIRTDTPVLGLFSAFVKEWVPLIDEYYYCM
jgi:hypothetical protein